MTAQPLHVGNVYGSNVRFFRSPLRDGLPDLPWFAFDDLAGALRLDHRLRQELLKSVLKDHGNVFRQIVTEAGPVKVAPVFVGSRMIDRLRELRRITRHAREDFDLEKDEAGCKMVKDLSEPEWLAYRIAARLRWGDQSENAA